MHWRRGMGLVILLRMNEVAAKDRDMVQEI